MAIPLWLSLQKLSADHDLLLTEHSDMKKKLEGSRARNRILSSELKALKTQIATLLDKGKHDNELVDALLVSPELTVMKTVILIMERDRIRAAPS